MSKPIVFMYSGQGSQYFNMGKELYDKHERFRCWMDHCDDLAEFYLETSLLDEIFQQGKGLSQPFDRLLYTNPALFCIEYSLTKMLGEYGIEPDLVIGYSLGEVTASVVSGAVDLEDGLQLTIETAKLLEAKAVPGGMISVIAPNQQIKQQQQLFSDCYLGGSNFDGNSVFGGTADNVDQLQSKLKAASIIYQRLPINYAFHSPLMEPHQADILALASQLNFGPMEVPIVSPAHGAQVQSLSPEHFWQVLAQPVEFADTVTRLLQQQDYTFIDVGPSGTLATFVKYLQDKNSASTTHDTINQFGRNIQSLDALLESMGKR